jgi:hypothetical protein
MAIREKARLGQDLVVEHEIRVVLAGGAWTVQQTAAPAQVLSVITAKYGIVCA